MLNLSWASFVSKFDQFFFIFQVEKLIIIFILTLSKKLPHTHMKNMETFYIRNWISFGNKIFVWKHSMQINKPSLRGNASPLFFPLASFIFWMLFLVLFVCKANNLDPWNILKLIRIKIVKIASWINEVSFVLFFSLETWKKFSLEKGWTKKNELIVDIVLFEIKFSRGCNI